jgi:hypothetical protein
MAAFVVAAAAAQGPASKAAVIWTGPSGGYRWTWSPTDVTAHKGAARPSLSLRRALAPQDDRLEGLTVYQCAVRPLSVVGSLLSYRRDDYWEGGAHPSGSISYSTVDAARPGRPLRLTDLFPDAAVRKALWNDPVVRRALSGAGVRREPQTAAALVAALEGKNFGGEDGFKYSFPGDLLTQFAFHHLEGDRVAVRLNVPWGAEIYRFQSTQIGLLLPVPSSLKAPLQRAATGREGFLMREARRRFGEKQAEVFEARGR